MRADATATVAVQLKRKPIPEHVFGTEVTMDVMDTQMKAAWRRLVGTALLWVGLAALVYVPSSGGGGDGVVVAGLGFVAFAFGLALFSDGVERDIVAQIRREPTAS